MKKATKIALACVLIASTIIASVTHAEFFGRKSKVASAESASPYFVDKDGKIKLPVKDKTKERGSDENPLFILEIVPYDGIAEFGYQIAGCEPINMKAWAWESKWLPDYLYQTKYGTGFIGFWPDEFPSYLQKKQEMQLPYLGHMTMTDGRGNYEVTKEEDAYAPIVGAFAGVRYKQEGSNYVEAADGTFRKVKKLTFAKKENGGYTFEPLTVEEVYKMTEAERNEYAQADMVFVEGTVMQVNLGNVTAQVNTSANEYIHRNNFLKYGIGLAYDMYKGKRFYACKALSEEELAKNPNPDIAALMALEGPDEEIVNQRLADYRSIVYTVTPEDLNLNTELINLADVIVICGGGKMNFVSDQDKEKFFRPELFSHDTSTTLGKTNLNKKGATFVTNPIDWDVVEKIFGRASGVNGTCPILIETESRTAGENDRTKANTMNLYYADGTTGTKNITGTQNNMYKLLLLLLQMENTTFQQLFGDDSDEENVLKGANFGVVNMASGNPKRKDGATLKTGTLKLNQSGDGISYWAKEVFYPYHAVPYNDFNTNTKVENICNMFGIGNSNGAYIWQSGEMQTAVRDSLFQYDGSTLASYNMHADKVADKTIATEDDLFGYEVYDYLQKVHPTNSRQAKVDTADVIWYLMNGLSSTNNPNLPIKADLRVLDIEPTSSYTKNEQFFKTLFGAQGNVTGKVTIDQINTSEFIGKRVELLSQYDLIFIGTNVASGEVSLPSGFTYAHTGKQVEISNRKGLYGILGSGDNNLEKVFVYSGNDLTKLMYDKLVACRDAGLPIMFGTGFFDNRDLTAAHVSASIDHNSYMYQLANDDIVNALYEDAFMNAGNYTAWTREKNKLRNALADVISKRARFDFTSSANYGLPKSYQNMDKSDYDNYINPNASDAPILQFKFMVDAPVGMSYDVRLYVDANGDGTFTENENIGAQVFTMKANGSIGVQIPSGRVEGGKEYIVRREIEGRIGSVNWKLDLAREGVAFASKTGLSAIKAFKAEDTADLPILQILPKNAKTAAGGEILLPDTTDLNNYKAGRTHSNTTVQRFLEGIYNRDGSSKINGLDITFTRVKEDAIIQSVKNTSGKSNPTADDYLVYLKKYKMVVSGFADMYDGISNSELLEALDRYMKLGYAILYTHDNSSFSGQTGSTPDVWGKNMTEKFRGAFGMDRYNVIANAARNLTSGDRPDFPWETSSTSTARNNITVGTSRKYLLAQGYSNGTIFRYNAFSGSNLESNKIKVINEGAITSYPYDIPEVASTCTTHPQYFQLDMENPNINVWYTLESSSSNTSISGYYNRLQGDVRNNYYIYNIENVTYSGVGHSGNLTPDEVKLFINTFVAAYRAAAKAVSIVVVNDDAVGKDGEYFLCTDVDSNDPADIIGNDIYNAYSLKTNSGEESTGQTYTQGIPKPGISKRVYFYIKDNNSYGNGNYTISTTVNGVTTSTQDLAIFKKDGTFVTKSKDLKSGYANVYYVDVPLKFEVDGSKTAVADTKVEFLITPWYTVNGGVTSPGAEESTVTIMPRGLFNLD